MSNQSTPARPGVLTKRKAIGWALLLLIPTLGAAYAVGVLAEPGATWFANITQRGQFDWTTASVAAAAVAAVLLAAFTAALAWTTSGNVSAIWGLADLGRQDQAARERPVVVVTRIDSDQLPSSGGGETSQVAVRAALRNVGAGPALQVRITVTYTGEGSTEPPQGTAFHAVVAPWDEPLDLRLVFARPAAHRPDWYAAEHFEVTGTYRDRRLEESHPIIHLRDEPPES